MHALIIGATGATGQDLLALLLNDEACTQVDIFVRREPDVQHRKLRVHIIDFDKPREWTRLVKGDVLFSCLGTTLKAAGSKEAQWTIDYDYQYQFAKAAADNGVPAYVLVSAGNASPYSRIFYTKMKGALEVAVESLGFPQLVIFRPPLLVRKGSDRPMEVLAMKLLRFFNRLGLLKDQQPLATEVLAQAMINSVKAKQAGVQKISGHAIRQLARAK